MYESNGFVSPPKALECDDPVIAYKCATLLCHGADPLADGDGSHIRPISLRLRLRPDMQGRPIQSCNGVAALQHVRRSSACGTKEGALRAAQTYIWDSWICVEQPGFHPGLS
jgi:hypothetical protein